MKRPEGNLGLRPRRSVSVFAMRVLFFQAALLLFSIFLLLPQLTYAQSSTRSDAPYLVPQTIFVGDSGRLVVPLGQTLAGINPFVLDVQEKLPETTELKIRRLELERRSGSSRLIIDFVAYAPGLLSLPGLEILGSGDEPLVFTGLEVQVASILDPSRMNLSEPAPPLAVPGTSFMVYGTILFFMFLLCIGMALTFWGRRHFRDLLENFRRRRLIRVMGKFLRCLRQECNFEKEGNEGYYLSLLSGEFREFLSLYSGINCRSLTPGEFLELPLSQTALALGPVYLCWLFRTWETLRFSGGGMEMPDIFQALEEIERLIITLEKEEKEKSFVKALGAPIPGGGEA